MTERNNERQFDAVREKLLGLSLESTRKSYYPQLQERLATLHENERRIRLMADNLPAQIALVDASKHYLFVNRQYEKIIGLKRDRIIGQSVKKVLGKANYAKVAEYMRKALEGNRVRFDTAIILADGRTRWMEINYVPDIDANGDVNGFYDLTSDLTDRKKALEALKESEQRFRAVFDNTYQLTGLLKPTGHIMMANQTSLEFAGMQESDILGLPFDQTPWFNFDKQVQQRVVSALNMAAMGQFVRYETIHKRGDGEIRHIDFSLKPVLDDTGKVAFLVAEGRDITQNKNLEQQLRQSYKMEAIGTLAGGIAHDFNNILSAVLGYSELLLGEVGNASPLRSKIHKIRQAGLRASELVRQILTFSRQTEHEAKPLQLSLIVKEALKLLRASIPSTIEIEEMIHTDAYCMADPTQMHQVIMNLCTNAAYAMQQTGGVLGVALVDLDHGDDSDCPHPQLTSKRHIKLTVSDTGIGMEDAVKNRIFDPFFTTKPKDEGTGMGLSLVHGIIKSTGGIIDVHSAPGHGTQFDVYIPAIQDSPEQDTGPAAEPIAGGTERILFVDDEEALVEIAQIMLSSLGYDVTCMVDSREALERFSAAPSRFDVVITDLTMPGLTGDQLARQMLAIRPDIPIIIATGFSEKLTDADIAGMGIRKLVLKPILIKEIAAAIRDALD